MKTSLLLALFLAVACASAPPTAIREADAPTPEGQAGLSLLIRFLTGTFETIAQEAGLGVSTPERLRLAPFWEGRRSQGEYWAYAEYARPGEDAKPFRQRIYRFTEAGGVITAAIFELPGDAARFVGEWRQEKPFARFSPGDLKERRGCAIRYLQQMEVLFNGGTAGTACRSELPGAHHHHAEFYVTSSTLRTIEDERDPSGGRVAGPSGPSEFRKTSPVPK
jgi:CpeT protein